MKVFQFLNIAQDDDGIDVYINGEIIDSNWQGLYDFFELEGTSPKSFKTMLDAADGKPLTVHINSIGGDLLAGMAMHSAIKNYKGKTTAVIDSVCASAATLPAMACKKVIMQTASTIMIHCASLWGTGGNCHDLEKDVEALKSLDNSIANAYEEKTGISHAELLELMEAETWMDAKKAKELGFADEINGKTEVPEAVIKNIIDNNKRLVACYRGVEQPHETEPAQADNSGEGGSRSYIGNFTSVEELEKAYASLRAEFTRKSQKLAELEAKNKTTEPQESDPAVIEPQANFANIKAKFEFAIAQAKAKNIL